MPVEHGAHIPLSPGKNGNKKNRDLPTGFRLNWTYKSEKVNAEDNKNKSSIWVLKNGTESEDKNWNLVSLMNLAKESKVKRIPESTVWEVLLKHRWEIEILQQSQCLNEWQMSEIVFKVFQELDLAYSSNTWFIEEDLSLGTEFYSALTYCPDYLLEAANHGMHIFTN